MFVIMKCTGVDCQRAGHNSGSVQANKRLLIATSNKSEYSVGTWLSAILFIMPCEWYSVTHSPFLK